MMKIETVFHENKAILNVYVPNKRASMENGHSNPLQYSCLERPMDREAWWAIYSSCCRVNMTVVT